MYFAWGFFVYFGQGKDVCQNNFQRTTETPHLFGAFLFENNCTNIWIT